MGKDMHDYIRLDEFGEWFYREKPVSASHMTSLRQMCTRGELARYARKICRRWFVSKEVFGDK